MLRYCCRAELCGSSSDISPGVFGVRVRWNLRSWWFEVLKVPSPKGRKLVTWRWGMPEKSLKTNLILVLPSKERQSDAHLGWMWAQLFSWETTSFSGAPVTKIFLPPKSFLELLPNPVLLQNPACWTRIKHKLPTWPILNSESISEVNFLWLPLLFHGKASVRAD